MPAASNDNPTAVVVDTNAFFEGRLTRSTLNSLSTMASLGLHVIVPDVVCRELASHAWEAYVDVEELLLLTAVDNRSIDQPQKIYKNFVSQIQASGAVIGRSPDSYYREGLLAQILKAPTASPKSGVTTGAVDHIVYMHALAASAKYSTVAVVTNDKALRTALSPRPGVQVFPDLASVRKGDVSHMRLPLQDALRALEILLSPEFKTVLAEKLHPSYVDQVTVVGVGDILRINDRQIATYVDVSAPYFTGSMEYYGHNVERWQLTVDVSSFDIEREGRIGTDPFAAWPPEVTTIEEYLATELSMIPSVLRPVPENEFVSDLRTPITYVHTEGTDVAFHIHRKQVANVLHSRYSVLREYGHGDDVFVDETQQTEILLQISGVAASKLLKGALATNLMNKALVLLS
ncbi:hypothetical protein [Arthrobacter sp. 754]|uniref:hypothetical protein n=1 Tax=Arthrobacter sp. 754 TaxID=3156315 RepID=UPI0033957CA9